MADGVLPVASLLDTPLLPDALRILAENSPNQVAVRLGETALTFAETDRAASGFAAALAERIGSAGSVVAMSSVLHPEFAIAYYGTLRSGNVVLPLSPLLREGDLGRVLTESSAAAAVLNDSMTAAVARASATPEHLLCFGNADRANSVAALAAGPVGALTELEPDAVACIHFTSGTTGQSKGVRLTHRNIAVNAVQVAEAHGVTGTSVTFNHLPSYHPMHLNSALIAGATQVLCLVPDPVATIGLAAGVTHYYSMPFRLARLATDPRLADLKLPGCEVILSGGSALSPVHAETLRAQFGIPVVQGYGLAETAPLVLSDGPAAPRPGSVGQVVRDTEVRVVDLTTREPLPVGERGEVEVRGPQVMRGYLGRPDGDGIGADGWLPTGDVGCLDEDGYLFLVDRIKDVFKRDNWLVSPTEIEAELLRHPGVADCAVVDQPDEFAGAVAAALIVPAGDEWVPRAGEIAAEFNAAQPYYKHLEHVELTRAIPRSPNGKLVRRELREALSSVRGSQNPGTALLGADTVVTFISKFTVKGEPEEFEKVFTEHAQYMAEQPGFVAYQMVRSLRDPKVYLNIGQWVDANAHKAVVTSPEFQAHVKKFVELVDVEADLYSTVSEASA